MLCCLLTGLPQRYQDSVRAIQPGLPLFLYNYSTRCLHGVYEVKCRRGCEIGLIGMLSMGRVGFVGAGAVDEE